MECKNCGTAIKGNDRKRFCSDSCRIKHWRKEKAKTKQVEAVCPYCGKAFIKERRNKIYCTERCGKQHRRDKEKKKEFDKGYKEFMRTQVECYNGKEIYYPYGRPD